MAGPAPRGVPRRGGPRGRFARSPNEAAGSGYCRRCVSHRLARAGSVSATSVRGTLRMFTGLIETQGIITRAERVSGGAQLEVYAPEFGRDMALGDSVAVDGACLTIAKFIRGAFVADVSEETLAKTTLGGAAAGQQGQPRARLAPVRPARRPHGLRARRRHGQAVAAPRRRQLRRSTSSRCRRAHGVHDPEGIRRGRRHLAHRRADPGRELRRRCRAAHRGGHDAEGQADRLGGQHRDRHDGEVREAIRGARTRARASQSKAYPSARLGDMLRDFAEGGR